MVSVTGYSAAAGFCHRLFHVNTTPQGVCGRLSDLRQNDFVRGPSHFVLGQRRKSQGKNGCAAQPCGKVLGRSGPVVELCGKVAEHRREVLGLCRKGMELRRHAVEHRRKARGLSGCARLSFTAGGGPCSSGSALRLLLRLRRIDFLPGRRAPDLPRCAGEERIAIGSPAGCVEHAGTAQG